MCICVVNARRNWSQRCLASPTTAASLDPHRCLKSSVSDYSGHFGEASPSRVPFPALSISLIDAILSLWKTASCYKSLWSPTRLYPTGCLPRN